MCVRLNVHRGTAYGLLFTSCVNETSAILENLFMRFPVSCHVMQYLTAVQQLHRKHQDGDLSRDSRMWMRRKTKRSNQRTCVFLVLVGWSLVIILGGCACTVGVWKKLCTDSNVFCGYYGDHGLEFDAKSTAAPPLGACCMSTRLFDACLDDRCQPHESHALPPLSSTPTPSHAVRSVPAYNNTIASLRR